MKNETVRLGFGGARDVAELFGLSERTVRAKVRSHEWPSYCIGGRRVFDLDELVQLVKKSPAPTTSERGLK